MEKVLNVCLCWARDGSLNQKTNCLQIIIYCLPCKVRESGRYRWLVLGSHWFSLISWSISLELCSNLACISLILTGRPYTHAYQGSQRLNNSSSITAGSKQQSWALNPVTQTSKSLSRCGWSKMQVPAAKGPEEERMTLPFLRGFHVTQSSKENSRNPASVGAIVFLSPWVDWPHLKVHSFLRMNQWTGGDGGGSEGSG